MLYIIFLLIILLLIILLIFLSKKQQKSGFGEYNKKERERIEEAKDKIMKSFDSKKEITNKDVRKLLKISDPTATRYLDELEKEGRIKCFGREGRSVFYKKNS